MISQSKAPIANWLANVQTKGFVKFEELVAVGLSVGLLAACAQISIHLPWTPVPITGQTFGVALLSLMLGARLGFASVITYLFLGGLGLPIFANFRFGLSFGPTFGYLVGMAASSFVMGALADRGWLKSWFRAWLACVIGSALVFSCGLIVLSFFVPTSALLAAGFFPFLPGDFFKSVLASGIASRFGRKRS